jgi:CRISPR/Cas system Type II protein with McrA/HNH and RuvC-like nuclease domain
MNSINSSEHRIIGLDIGIASVGWAVITPNRILNLGVRAFDKAETDKEGDSLNLKRRAARLMRHRIFIRGERGSYNQVINVANATRSVAIRGERGSYNVIRRISLR